MDERTAALLRSVVTCAFLGTWVVLGIATMYVFPWKDVAAKRWWVRRGTVLILVLFVLGATTLVYLEHRSLSSLSVVFFLVPFAVLFGLMSVKGTRFCDHCGAVTFRRDLFVPVEFCERCRSRLRVSEATRRDESIEE